MAMHQVINMVAMRHGFVAAVGTVSVGLLMSGAVVVRRAFFRIRRGYFDLVVVDMIAVSIMQVAIVKIIGVAVVFHGGVPAIWAHARGCEPPSVVGECQSLFQSFRKRYPVVARSRECAAEPALTRGPIPVCVHRFIKSHLTAKSGT